MQYRQFLHFLLPLGLYSTFVSCSEASEGEDEASEGEGEGEAAQGEGEGEAAEGEGEGEGEGEEQPMVCMIDVGPPPHIAGEPVSISSARSTTTEGASIVSSEWTVISFPVESIVEISENSLVSSSPGTITIQLTIIDSLSRSRSCSCDVIFTTG